jgi:hypothetical protein
VLRLTDGEVAAPFANLTRDRIYVARKLGQRDPPEVKLQPREYQSLRDSAAAERSSEVMDELFGTAALKARFGFSFPSREAAEKDAANKPASS